MLPNLFAKNFVVAVVVCLGFLGVLGIERKIGPQGDFPLWAIPIWIVYVLASIAAGNALYYSVFERDPLEVRMATKLRWLVSISGVDKERAAARGVVFKWNPESKGPQARVLLKGVPKRGRYSELRSLLQSCEDGDSGYFSAEKINQNLDVIIDNIEALEGYAGPPKVNKEP